MYILRIESDDASTRPPRVSVHPDERSAKAALSEHARVNWASAGDADGKTFSIEVFEVAGVDPFETVRSLHALIQSFVRERIESIAEDGQQYVELGDFETLEGVDTDTQDRIRHVLWFLGEANRLVGRHGMGERDL